MSHEIRTRWGERKLQVLDKAEVFGRGIREAEFRVKEWEQEETREKIPQNYASDEAGRYANGTVRTAYVVGRSARKRAAQQSKKEAAQKREQVIYGEMKERRERRAAGDVKEVLPESVRCSMAAGKRLGERERVFRPGRQEALKSREERGTQVRDRMGTSAYRGKSVENARKMALRKNIQMGRVFSGRERYDRNLPVPLRDSQGSIRRKTRTGFRGIEGAAIAGGTVLLLIVIVVLSVSQFSYSGTGSTSALPVSAEVEAYDALIRQYASAYGISQYVDLVKAVMMQESGGTGTDPMQSSESGYNTRFSHTPNAITDPEYSIDIGIHNLADCLTAAGAESPLDLDAIRLALQSYNFGNGYLAWAKENYGGWSLANAAEFSEMMAARLGWESYGDKEYVPHVLRYYPYGQFAFGGFGGNQEILQVALSQEGNIGGEPYWSWYGYESRVEWCACFVSWCADQCGLIESGAVPKFSSCAAGVSWFQDNGKWRGRGYEPAPGTIIFFDWNGDGHSDHVGIVEKCESGIVYTVEGNNGNAVRRSEYGMNDGDILGYCTIL